MVLARRSLALVIAAWLGVGLAAAPAAAQAPRADLAAPQAPARVEAMPTLPEQITPELYYYLNELRRQDDPKQAVRRKAELVAAQRTERIAARKWYGLSNARPTASSMPFTEVYSPAWIGNGYHRYDWLGRTTPTSTFEFIHDWR